MVTFLLPRGIKGLNWKCPTAMMWFCWCMSNIPTCFRSSHQMCSIKRGVLTNFANFTGKGLPQACNFIGKETLARVFSCKICEICKNTFLQNTSGGKIERLRSRSLPVNFMKFLNMLFCRTPSSDCFRITTFTLFFRKIYKIFRTPLDGCFW